MKPVVVCAVALAGVSLVACGGGGDDAGSSSSAPADTGTSSVSRETTVPAPAADAASTGDGARSRALVNSCALVRRREVVAAFGVTTARMRALAGHVCEYRAGTSHILQVQPPAHVPAAQLAYTEKSLEEGSAPGVKAFSGRGYVGLAKPTPDGTQAYVQLLAHGVSVTLTLTDLRAHPGAAAATAMRRQLLDGVVSLGRAAGARL